jgi:hypothetical protein
MRCFEYCCTLLRRFTEYACLLQARASVVVKAQKEETTATEEQFDTEAYFKELQDRVRSQAIIRPQQHRPLTAARLLDTFDRICSVLL